MTCYHNARVASLSNGVQYNNLTLHSCQCFVIAVTGSAFQYDHLDQSCYTFSNNLYQSDLRVKNASRVCFVNQTLMFDTTTRASSTNLPSAPVIISTSVSAGNYYATESISLSNNITLTSLSIVINVPKTFGVQTPNLFSNFPGSTVNQVINQTNDSIRYVWQLIPGLTIPTGQWQVTAQYNLIGQMRPTINDTYVIQISSHQDIVGHF